MLRAADYMKGLIDAVDTSNEADVGSADTAWLGALDNRRVQRTALTPAGEQFQRYTASSLSALRQGIDSVRIPVNYRHLEDDDPEAFTRRYHYYDPISTLPAEGQAWWREQIARGVDELLAELQPQHA